MKKRSKFSVWILLIGAIVLIICLLLLIPPVADKVSTWTNIASDKLRSVAQTVAGIVVGIILILVGIASLEIPILGGALIIAGLGMMGWNIYPLWASPTTVTTE